MKNALALAALLALVLLLPAVASAQPNPSNIDPNQAFVWSETVGWINFRPTHGGVTVRGAEVDPADVLRPGEPGEVSVEPEIMNKVSALSLSVQRPLIHFS